MWEKKSKQKKQNEKKNPIKILTTYCHTKPIQTAARARLWPLPL